MNKGPNVNKIIFFTTLKLIFSNKLMIESVDEIKILINYYFKFIDIIKL